MGMRLKMQSSDYKVYEPGEYLAKVVKVEPTIIKVRATGEEVDYWKFSFEFVEGEDAGELISGQASAFLSPNSKLYKWLGAIGVDDINIDEEFDSDRAVNKYVNIIIKNTVVKAKNENFKDSTYSNVVDLIGLRKSQADKIGNVTHKNVDKKETAVDTKVEKSAPVSVKIDKSKIPF